MLFSPESQIFSVGTLFRDAAGQHPVHHHEQDHDEHDGPDHAGDDDVQRVELAHVLLVVGRLAHAEERPCDGAHRLQERALAAHRVSQRVGHDAGPWGAGGILPPTSKKVYDSVIVATSFGNFGSITNITGHWRRLTGINLYLLLQKHLGIVLYVVACLVT